MKYLIAKMSARECRDAECLARDFHTHHLTWLGRIRYSDRKYISKESK